MHGVAVADPYRWLEDAEAPDTQAWVEAHNDRTRAVLDARPDRAGLVARYAELFSAGTAGAPAIRGGRLFSIDRWGDLEQAVLVVRDVHGDRIPAARTLIDPHELTGDATAALDWYAPSVDGRLVAEASPGPGERIVVAPVDITALRHERATPEAPNSTTRPRPARRIAGIHARKRTSAELRKEATSQGSCGPRKGTAAG